MWARSRGCGAKYHWYESSAFPDNHTLCHVGPALTPLDCQIGMRTQPLHADRCKLCVRALRKRETTKRCGNCGWRGAPLKHYRYERHCGRGRGLVMPAEPACSDWVEEES